MGQKRIIEKVEKRSDKKNIYIWEGQKAVYDDYVNYGNDNSLLMTDHSAGSQ